MSESTEPEVPDWRSERDKVHARIDEAIKHHRLEIRSTFIPWSKSRYKHEKQPSLNWSVTLVQRGTMAQEVERCNDRDILTVDYTAGCGQCPSYQKPSWHDRSAYEDEAVRQECETGRAVVAHGLIAGLIKGKEIKPDIRDVLYCLLSDAEVMNSGSFEEWANDCGENPDSITAQKTYHACLRVGLQLHAKLGDAVLMDLREAFQDY